MKTISYEQGYSCAPKLATFDAQDRLKDFASNQYLFNLRGQLLERTDSSTIAKTKYTYNAFGDLKSVVLPNQTKIDYLIDGEHHRVGRLLNGNLDRYYGFDAEGRVLYERQLGAGGVFRLYIYLPQSHSPEAFLDGNTGVYYKLIKDHLGSIRLVINANTGIVAQELDYDEWGQVIKDTNPGFQLFGFAGGVYDKDTKLVRFGARDYDAETGRWTAKDPLLFNGGDVNLYGYVGNDPVNFVDPSGFISLDLTGDLRMSYIARDPVVAAISANPNVLVIYSYQRQSNGTYATALGGERMISIALDPRMNRPDSAFYNTVAHESVHAQQLASGQFSYFNPAKRDFATA